MAVIVEDGTIIVGANSFVSLARAKEYNVERGRSLTGSDDVIEGQIVLACDYIKLREPDIIGFRTYGRLQELPFPRENLYVHGEYLPSIEIPQEIQNAQCELVWVINQGIDILRTVHEAPLKRRKTGPLEKEWFGPAGAVEMPAVMQWLQLFLLDTSMYRLRVERI